MHVGEEGEPAEEQRERGRDMAARRQPRAVQGPDRAPQRVGGADVTDDGGAGRRQLGLVGARRRGALDRDAEIEPEVVRLDGVGIVVHAVVGGGRARDARAAAPRNEAPDGIGQPARIAAVLDDGDPRGGEERELDGAAVERHRGLGADGAKPVLDAEPRVPVRRRAELRRSVAERAGEGAGERLVAAVPGVEGDIEDPMVAKRELGRRTAHPHQLDVRAHRQAEQPTELALEVEPREPRDPAQHLDRQVVVDVLVDVAQQALEPPRVRVFVRHDQQIARSIKRRADRAG